MPANPVIERLVKGAMERCGERVREARRGGKVKPALPEPGGHAGFTSQVKRSHGL